MARGIRARDAIALVSDQVVKVPFASRGFGNFVGLLMLWASRKVLAALTGGSGPSDLSQSEALVAVGGDCVAFLDVRREAADVWHEDTRLTGNVGADIPGAAR